MPRLVLGSACCLCAPLLRLFYDMPVSQPGAQQGLISNPQGPSSLESWNPAAFPITSGTLVQAGAACSSMARLPPLSMLQDCITRRTSTVGSVWMGEAVPPTGAAGKGRQNRPAMLQCSADWASVGHSQLGMGNQACMSCCD